ncbi:MAG: glycosyltransferase [Roseobacter sp.]
MNAPVVGEKTPEETLFSTEISALRSKMNLPAKAPLFVFTGFGLGGQRGLSQIAEALTLLPEVHLVIWGPRGSRHDRRLMRIAKKLKVSDRIHLLPPVPHSEVIGTIRACDVSILPIQDAGLGY